MNRRPSQLLIRSISSIAAAIGRLLGDGAHARRLADRGRERCREYTWDRTAATTLTSYARAVGGR